jgi:hypothetical protein
MEDSLNKKSELLERMEGLLELYKNDPINFVYVDRKQESALYE